MKQLVVKTLNIGIQYAQSDWDKRRIQILNFICVFAILVILLSLALEYFLKGAIKPLQLITYGISLLAVATCIYLQHQSAIKSAKVLFLLHLMPLIFINANFAIKGQLHEYNYVVLPFLAILFFDKRIFAYAIFVCTIVLFYVPNYYLHIYPGDTINNPVALFIFTAIFSFTLLLKNLNERTERKLKDLNQQLNVSKQRELELLQLKALRSQMNPHFIFNSLNSIQALVLKNETQKSYDYIVLFADLVRKTLYFSEREFIEIEEEIKFLNIYLELESLRLKNDFSYTIDNKMNQSATIPSLLVQPLLENAIHHGLLHKKGKKNLNITFQRTADVGQCIVRDNGIGRAASLLRQKRQPNHHRSFSIQAIEKRLELFSDLHGTTYGISINDLHDDQKQAQGTEVIISFPCITHKHDE